MVPPGNERWTRHIDVMTVAYRRIKVDRSFLTQETSRRVLIDAAKLEVHAFARLELELERAWEELEWHVGYDLRSADGSDPDVDVTVVLRVSQLGVDQLLEGYEGAP